MIEKLIIKRTLRFLNTFLAIAIMSTVFSSLDACRKKRLHKRSLSGSKSSGDLLEVATLARIDNTKKEDGRSSRGRLNKHPHLNLRGNKGWNSQKKLIESLLLDYKDPQEGCKYEVSLYMSAKEIDDAILKVALQIYEVYGQCRKPVVLVPVLEGGSKFAERLKEKLASMEMYVQSVSVRYQSYGDDFESGKEVTKSGFEVLEKMAAKNGGKLDAHIVGIDDVFETGGTVTEISNYIMEAIKPRSLAWGILLDKEVGERKGIKKPDFAGRKITDNYFLVGFGMDLFKYCREFLNIFVVKEVPIEEK